MKKSIEKFIAQNFGNVHLKGFKYLVRACELYENGEKSIKKIYEIIAKEYNTISRNIERNIRHYNINIRNYLCIRCRLNEKITNGILVSAIVYTVKKEDAQ